MVTQRHKQQSGTLYIILIFMLLSLLFMGVCFSNLLHFYVEDIYNIPLNRSLLFGYEYAHSLSWLIIMTPVFLVLQLFQWYRLKKNPDFLKLIMMPIHHLHIFSGKTSSLRYFTKRSLKSLGSSR